VEQGNRNSALAAAAILIGFGMLAYFMPTIMLAIGGYSPAVAGVVAVAFVGAFFLVFYLRGRFQRRNGGE
jgi:hypothetical protein